MFLPSKPDSLEVLPGSLMVTFHLTLLGLVKVRTGDSSIAVRSQHFSPPLLDTRPTGGATGAPATPPSHLTVVHSTILLEVMTAISHIHATVITVAGLGVEVQDDAVGVGVGGVHLAVSVLSLTAFPGSPAASEQSSRESCMKS